jgi:predicted protein tyrosine phosphatase
MNIYVLSKIGAQMFHSRLIGDAPYAMISILGNPDEQIKLEDDPKRIFYLRMNFDDLDEDIEPEKYHLFNEDDAKEILAFAKKAKNNIDALIVHCEAGISRSPAVGLALAQLLDTQNQDRIKHRFPLYNKHVYNTIIKTHFGGNNIVDIYSEK